MAFNNLRVQGKGQGPLVLIVKYVQEGVHVHMCRKV
jgi:hypothetical protein